MNSILFVTVGGSPQPIVTAISSLNADRVVFICSDGSKGSISQVLGADKPCEVRKGSEVVERLPNIPTQVGLGDRFDPERDVVKLDNPDDLSECYRKILEKIQQIQHEAPKAKILADYTGGTKTMSLALSLATLDTGAKLYITTATTRQNTIKVESGEKTKLARTAGLTVSRLLENTIPAFLSRFDYAAAKVELNSILQNIELPSDEQRRVEEYLDLCEGFDAWDRFDHLTAWQRIQLYMEKENIQKFGLFLKRTIASRAILDSQFSAAEGTPGHGYEVVQDLVLNAERRATQERYDDAVGRLYRALELLEQLRLYISYGILTGDVDLQKLPEHLHADLEAKRSPRNKKIQLGLFQSYDLLANLPDDPLGKLFLQRKDSIQDAISLRNNSLFAHGFSPIAKPQFEGFYKTISEFVQDGIAALVPTNPQQPQFPTNF